MTSLEHIKAINKEMNDFNESLKGRLLALELKNGNKLFGFGGYSFKDNYFAVEAPCFYDADKKQWSKLAMNQRIALQDIARFKTVCLEDIEF
jgi:hypothetical protein